MFKQFISRLHGNWIISRLLPIFVLFLMMLVFSILTKGRFSSSFNLKLLFNQALIVGTVATGAAFIFGTGNVNIAMGASTAIACTAGATAYLHTGSVTLMILAAIATGIAILLVSVSISTALKVKVLFVTIVMMVLLAALQQELLQGAILSLPFDMVAGLRNINLPLYLFLAYLILCIFIFHFTKIGRSIKFIGSNDVCASQTGIFKDKYLIIAFLIAGVGVGLGAIQTMLRTGSVTSSTAMNLNMNVVLAITLGGMPVFGGSKSFVYAGIIGAFTVVALESGLLMVGVSSTLIQGIRGILFLILVFAGQKRPEMLPSRQG